jgi:hypothetical protein
MALLRFGWDGEQYRNCMELGSLFRLSTFDFYLHGNWEIRETHGGASLCTRENTRERSLSWLDRYEGCVAVAFCFFFARSEGTNTFYLITPRSQELCERDWVADEGWDCIAGGWMLLSGDVDDVGER